MTWEARTPPQRASDAFSELGNILCTLNLRENLDKATPPSTKMVFLGIHMDTTNFTMSIPPQKLVSIQNILAQWKVKTTATRKQLQSLLGSLNHVSCCVRPGRSFINRLLNTLRNFPENEGHMTLDYNFHKDISWWLYFMEDFNGVSFMPELHRSTPDTVFATDASTWGVGGYNNGHYFHAENSPFTQSLHINHLELLAIVIALQLWSHDFCGKRIVVNCDNMCAVDVINLSHARVPFLQCCLREIRFLEANHSFQLSAVHISGVSNRLPDYLSRWGLSTRYPTLFYASVTGTELHQSMVSLDTFHFTHDW